MLWFVWFILLLSTISHLWNSGCSSVRFRTSTTDMRTSRISCLCRSVWWCQATDFLLWLILFVSFRYVDSKSKYNIVLALQKFRSGLIFPSFFLTNQATTFGKKCTCSKTYHGTEYIGMISEMISLPPQMTTPPTSWKRSSYQTMKFSLLLPPLEYWTHPESLFLPFRV